MKDRPQEHLLFSSTNEAFPFLESYCYECREQFTSVYEAYEKENPFVSEEEFLRTLWKKCNPFLGVGIEETAMIECGYFLKKYWDKPSEFFHHPFVNCRMSSSSINYKTQYVMEIATSYQVEEIVEKAIENGGLDFVLTSKGKRKAFSYKGRTYHIPSHCSKKDFVECLAKDVASYLRFSQEVRYVSRFDLDYEAEPKEMESPFSFDDILNKDWKQFAKDMNL